MHRFKFFAGFTVLLLFLYGLTVSGNDPMPIAENAIKDFSGISNDPKKSQPNPVLPERLQRELKLALQAYFRKAIASGDVVGAGVSIVKGDQTLLAEGFGKRDDRSGKAVDGNTVFRLGSLSKGFTGILAADLKHEGKINWEDRVSDCIPEFQLGDQDNTGKITLGHLLSHTSGAPYHSYTNLVEAGLPLGDIAKRFEDVTPISDPGSMYSYQNALFALSGEMMAKVTGQELTEALEQRFFNPLEMCSTTMDYEKLKATENVAKPHVRYRRGWRSGRLTDSYFNAVAAGGINSNAVDMGKWMQLLLGHKPEVMGGQAIKEAFTPVIKIPGRSKYYQRWPGHKASYYGLGWRIHTYDSGDASGQKTIWHHGGSVNHFRNEIAIFPEEDLGICVLLNNNSRIARRVIPDLYHIVQEVYRDHTGSIAGGSEVDPTSLASGSAGR